MVRAEPSNVMQLMSVLNEPCQE